MTSSILAATDMPLLDVRDLHVDFINGRAVTNAVRGVSFQLGREKLAIVGESGSGKSTVGRALLRLHPAKAQITATRMQFGDVDLRTVSEAQMRGIRGKRISMIMQDPKYSLNPVVCVGDQIAEARADPPSGAQGRGQSQSAGDAGRGAYSPARARLSSLSSRNLRRAGAAHHDRHDADHRPGAGDRRRADFGAGCLGAAAGAGAAGRFSPVPRAGADLYQPRHQLVRSFCDRVLVMYAGRVVESIAACDLHNAKHPYTQGLINALPEMNRRRPVLPVLQRQASWLTE